MIPAPTEADLARDAEATYRILSDAEVPPSERKITAGYRWKGLAFVRRAVHAEAELTAAKAELKLIQAETSEYVFDGGDFDWTQAVILIRGWREDLAAALAASEPPSAQETKMTRDEILRELDSVRMHLLAGLVTAETLRKVNCVRAAIAGGKPPLPPPPDKQFVACAEDRPVPVEVAGPKELPPLLNPDASPRPGESAAFAAKAYAELFGDPPQGTPAPADDPGGYLAVGGIVTAIREECAEIADSFIGRAPMNIGRLDTTIPRHRLIDRDLIDEVARAIAAEIRKRNASA